MISRSTRRACSRSPPAPSATPSIPWRAPSWPRRRRVDWSLPADERFQAIAGGGVQATVDGDTVLIGTPALLDKQGVALPTA